jgi:hypothetical protein
MMVPVQSLGAQPEPECHLDETDPNYQTRTIT